MGIVPSEQIRADNFRGMIFPYAGAEAPIGFLVCDGAAVSRVTYAGLYSLIGDTYGAGDGATTFNIPNLKGKVVVGVDSSQTEFDTLAEAGGAKTHTLTEAELATHSHTIPLFQQTGAQAQVSREQTGTSSGLTATSNNSGGNQPHNNLQPYLVLNYIIKT